MAANVIALAAAAALVAVFVLWRRPELELSLWMEAILITTAFALLAWYARGVDWKGALAGASVAFVLAARDLRMFLVLLLVFALTLAATRAGAGRKLELRTAEAVAGRSASQVMANLGVAAVVTVLAPNGWPLLALAALAEVAADTSSSEIGMAFPGKTVLITNWQLVPPGMDGGVSSRGTAAALLAAALVAIAGKLLGLVPLHHAAIVLYAGFLGSLADSLLGATLERRRWLTNDLVNLFSTVLAAAIAWFLV